MTTAPDSARSRAPAPPLTPLAARDIRLWRRPGALVWVWFGRLVLAWLVSAPLVAALSSSDLLNFPNGDALLFEPGAQMLSEVLRIQGKALAGALGESLRLLLLALLLSLIPLAMLLVALCHEGKLVLSDWVARALRHLPAFVFLGGATLLMRALLLLVFGLGLSALRAPLNGRLDERSADLWLLGLAGVALVVMLLLSLVHDLARASAVRYNLSGLRALRHGYGMFRERTLAALQAYLMPGFWGLALVVFGAMLIGALELETPGEGRAVTAAALHQLIALGLVSLRGWWLTEALKLASED